MSRFIKITERDNVAVALEALKAGETVLGVTLTEDVPAGHKFALCDIAEGENVIKYGAPIGHATEDIAAGEWVHIAVIYDSVTHAYRSLGEQVGQAFSDGKKIR